MNPPELFCQRRKCEEGQPSSLVLYWAPKDHILAGIRYTQNISNQLFVSKYQLICQIKRCFLRNSEKIVPEDLGG